MGRYKTNPARKYFDYVKPRDISICRICGKNMKTNHAANLERHLKRIHQDHFQILQIKKEEIKREEEQLHKQQQPTFKQEDLPHFNVKVTEANVVEACIELVTVNDCPFELLEYSGFRKLVKPIVDAMNQPTFMSIANVQSKLASAASNIVYKIRAGMQHNFVTLKLDTVFKSNKSVLIVNAQFVHDGRLKEYVLAAKVLPQNDPDFINEVVIGTLKKYNISPDQVFSLIVDGGLSALEEEHRKVQTCKSYQFEIDPIDTENISINNKVIGVKCAASALESAINDTLKDADLDYLLGSCRTIIEKVISPSSNHNVHEIFFKIPILDCAHRWNTTYKMLEHFVESSNIYMELSKSDSGYFLSSDKWKKLHSIYDGLKIVKNFSTLLQKERSTLSDFYGSWLEYKINLEKSPNYFTEIFLKHLRSNEANFLNEELFLSAIYLDPRYQLLLSLDQKMQARIHLEQLWQRILQTNIDFGVDFECNKIDVNSQMDIDDEVENLLKRKEIENDLKKVQPIFDIQNKLLNFDGVQRLARKSNILKYWEDNKKVNSSLCALAKIVHSVPATHASLENAFCALDFLYCENNKSLSSDILEDMLLIKLNQKVPQ